jgi:hypothetical protein
MNHFNNRAILARFACLRNEKGRWGRKFQLSVMGSEGCFTGKLLLWRRGKACGFAKGPISEWAGTEGDWGSFC